MRAALLVAAAAALFASATAKDLIAPVTEQQLDQRIALFQQEAREAPCDPQERICAMGRSTLARDAAILAWHYPECGDHPDCAARKKARNVAATLVALSLAPPANDLFLQSRKTGKQPGADEVAAYTDEVKQALAKSSCPATQKVCAIGRMAYLVEIDQLVRFQAMTCDQIGVEKGADARQACWTKMGTAMLDIDKYCRTEFDRIIDQFGWPDTVHWGDATQNNAWLLAQHADEDQVLQKKYLALIKASFEQGYTPASSYAYIADRQATHQNTPQLYGTQGKCAGEGAARHWEPNPIADEAHLAARRAEAGMEPYTEYRKTTDKMCQGKL